jgi:hypothetical protein
MKIFSILFFAFITVSINAQSFTTVDELLQLSELDPLAFEKSLTSKGFSFYETDGIKTKYSNLTETVSLTISPRMVSYVTYSRIFFLEANSRILKSGYRLVNTEAVLISDGTKVKAQQFEKDKLTVWLGVDKIDGETIYYIQVDNSSPSSLKNAGGTETLKSKENYKYKGDKTDISFGFFSVGLMISRGITAEKPSPTTTIQQDFNGESGIGTDKGFEFDLGGIVGLYGLNKKLPHALDFGILIAGGFNILPYSYKSLGVPYSDYTYNGFITGRFGVGPTLTITPFRNADFHLSGFYKFSAGGNFAGGYKYSGTDYNEVTMTRDDDVSFTLIKSYGAMIHGGSVFGGIEFSKYIDKGKFTITESVYNSAAGEYVDMNTPIEAKLPFDIMSIKIGLLF